MTSASEVRQLSRLTLGERDGLVAVLKVYLDESGVHDGSPVLTVAAYLARPRDWANWTKKWNVAKKPIKVFHAVDAQNLAGEFQGWSGDDRDTLVKRILPTIAEANFPGIVIGIHMDEFKKAMQDKADLLEIFGTPYAACFQWLVTTIMLLQHRTGSTERIGFVHESNDYKHDALEAFAYIQKFHNPQGSVIGLQFGEKADYTPLQAADILAYEGNKRMRDPDRPVRRPWQVLNPDRRIMAAQYGRDNMTELVSRLEKVRDGRIGEIDLGDGWTKFLKAAPFAKKLQT